MHQLEDCKVSWSVIILVVVEERQASSPPLYRKRRVPCWRPTGLEGSCWVLRYRAWLGKLHGRRWWWWWCWWWSEQRDGLALLDCGMRRLRNEMKYSPILKHLERFLYSISRPGDRAPGKRTPNPTPPKHTRHRKRNSGLDKNGRCGRWTQLRSRSELTILFKENH